jgi:hypothetical protein
MSKIACSIPLAGSSLVVSGIAHHTQNKPKTNHAITIHRTDTRRIIRHRLFGLRRSRHHLRFAAFRPVRQRT